MKIRVLSIFSLLLIYINCVSAQVSENALKTWQDNKLAMKILFSIQKNPKGESGDFNYDRFNADSIAALAEKSGMRTVIAPAKIGNIHFFRTSTDSNSRHSRDIIKELSEACSKRNIQLGVYLSITDKKENKEHPVSKKLSENTKKLITELLTGYGRISEIDFDMEARSPEESHELYSLVHKLQPDCMVSSNAGNGQYDFCTLLKYHFQKDFLECNWRYDSSLAFPTSSIEIDNAQSDAKRVIQKMTDAIACGGGFTFNLHLGHDCKINAYDKDILHNIGLWMKKNGNAVYKTQRSPFNESFDWGTVTRNGNTLYFILSGKYPKDGRIKLYMPEYELVRADGKLATCIQKNGLIDIAIPASAYKGKTVNVLTLKFKQEIFDSKPEPIRAITLKQSNATPLYSIDGFDFSSTYRSTVKYSWYFEQIMLKQLEIIYTSQEKGKTLDIELDGKEYKVTLDNGKPSTLSTANGTVWGKQYICGPDNKMFHSPQTIDTDIENPPVKNSVWKEIQAGKHTFAAKANDTYYVMQNIESPRTQHIMVDAGAGNGIEIFVNGKSVMKHLNPYRCEFRTEKVLLPLQKGSNRIVMKIYNRFEKNISYILRPSEDRTIYKQELTLPEMSTKKNHILTVRQSGMSSAHSDTELSNLRIRLRRIAL